MSSPRNALIVCDMQPDWLTSIQPAATRQALLDAVHASIIVAEQADWWIVFLGLQFEEGYANLSENHKLYGSFKRLYQSNSKIQWFLPGRPGSQIEASLLLNTNKKCVTIWRSQHLPSRQLLEFLQTHEIAQVTVVGIKASLEVQAVCQAICDLGTIQVRVIRECIQDDNAPKLQAMVDHLLPLYASVLSLTDWIDQVVGLENLSWSERKIETPNGSQNHQCVYYVANCGRGGHGPIFTAHLLERPSWRTFPIQPWYTTPTLLGAGGKQYKCPLGKRVLDFCDEPRFSRISMFLKGREWLDEKDKLMTVAGTWLPQTWLIQYSQYVRKQPHDNNNDGPWFVKDVNKNGGKAIQICHSAKQCLGLTLPGHTYVVQQHISNPQLTAKGQKCHLKFYNLLINDGSHWQLFCYQDAFVCVSPNLWSVTDLQIETQVTVLRNDRLQFGVNDAEIHHKLGVSFSYRDCQAAMTDIVRTAVRLGKLLQRNHQKQFELFSTDFMLDTSGRLWLIECNFSPVLYDPEYHVDDHTLTTRGLRLYHDRYHQRQDHEINDRPMIRDALSIALDGHVPQDSRWDLAVSFSNEKE